MTKLVIISDDFTGALDTGVKFASKGIRTKVTTNIDFLYEDNSLQVLVIDAETRHCTPEEAYEIVFKITKLAIKYGVKHIYKKTDSALRGNLGKELEAVLRASNSDIMSFIPALPKINRITKNGIHYIDGLEVSKSVFGVDPFEPVKNSYIPDIINETSNINTVCIKENNFETHLDIQVIKPTIYVYDATTDKRLINIGENLKNQDMLNVIAGCAGFAEYLPDLLELDRFSTNNITLYDNLVFVCGSVNPITLKQIEYAKKNGFSRIVLTPEQKLDSNIFEKSKGQQIIKDIKSQIKKRKPIIIDTNDLIGKTDTIKYAKENNISKEQARICISYTLGKLIEKIFNIDSKITIMIAGGDTLFGFMKYINCFELLPIAEISDGSVISQIDVFGQKRNIITKSGGFGNETLLLNILDCIKNKEKI